MKLAFVLISIVCLQLGVANGASFELQIENAKNLLASGNYYESLSLIRQARRGVASFSARPSKPALAGARPRAKEPSAINPDVALNALSTALAKYAQNDLPGTIDALDLASAAAASLNSAQSPTERLFFAEAKVQEARSSHVTGVALQVHLHRAARDARAAGKFDESLTYAEQVISEKLAHPASSPYIHWAHIIAGLDRLAKGEIDLAASELLLSSQSLPSAGTYAPSMALAQALMAVPGQHDAIAAYLGSVAAMQNWPDRALATKWLSDFEAGGRPDFGAFARLGI